MTNKNHNYEQCQTNANSPQPKSFGEKKKKKDNMLVTNLNDLWEGIFPKYTSAFTGAPQSCSVCAIQIRTVDKFGRLLGQKKKKS